jgi:YVTN family beta-propeller protein
MRLARVLFGLALVVMSNATPAGAQQRSPVYVGARVCAGCHSGPETGHQFSLWLLSKHSMAYATLAMPEAKEIAELSGIRLDPQESFTCLGCHSSGAQAEDWEKDETFRIEDGVQCETCHGPGSEYMSGDVMADRQAAMKAGLRMPDGDTCLRCHKPKGTHVAVLNSPQQDVVEAMSRIAHPRPSNSKIGRIGDAGAAADEKAHDPKYVGSGVCGQCHSGPESAYQYSVGRTSAHARAWATLATPRARELARERGLDGDPQQSPACLRCHSTGASAGSEIRTDSFSPDEGVGCEACHGAGSEYALEATMRDPSAARSAGLRDAGLESCLPCHEDAHGEQFAAKLEEIAHPSALPEPATAIRYKTPLNLALRPDGSELYVTCSASDSVIVVDPERRTAIAEISVGRQPEDVAFSPDGSRAFVTNMFDDTVSVIDVATRAQTHVLPVGDEPHGVLTDDAGKRLYVLNAASDDISVYDAVSLKWIKNLSASRRPWSLSRSPDGGSLLATHALSRFVPFRTRSETEVTLIDSERAVVEDRSVFEGANLLMGIDWHPSGDFALVTLNRTKNLVPMTRLLQGWTITNGLGIFWRSGDVDQVLLDEPDMSFPDPTDVAITPDGRYALVTSSGSNRVAVVDLEKLMALVLGSSDYERQHVLPNHLGKPTEFVAAHIATRDSPRGVLVMPNGKTAFVANALDDSLTAIDLERLEATGRIDLGGPETITQTRFGERLFHSADIAFHRQFSCHSCHPDGHVDGLTYDIEPDGIGMSPVDNRTLRGILDTAPFKWKGTNPSLQRQCGPRLAVFFTRVEPFTPDELTALERYISTIPRPPNRHRPLGADLTPAQRNGKRLFERAVTNDGRPIAIEDRCITCHFPPYYSDRTIRDVGTRMKLDRETHFDVPHLNNIYDSAPYLHNGIAETLEEIWTVHNPYDSHGVTNDMTKDQLNDLIEYLKTL